MNKETTIKVDVSINLQDIFEYEDLDYEIRASIRNAVMDNVKKSKQYKQFVKTQTEICLKNITTEGVYALDFKRVE